METVFSSSDLEARCGLLKTVHNFLLSESAKFEADLKGVSPNWPDSTGQLTKLLYLADSVGNKLNVKMDELVGNTSGFAEGR